MKDQYMRPYQQVLQKVACNMLEHSIVDCSRSRREFVEGSNMVAYIWTASDIHVDEFIKEITTAGEPLFVGQVSTFSGIFKCSLLSVKRGDNTS